MAWEIGVVAWAIWQMMARLAIMTAGKMSPLPFSYPKDSKISYKMGRKIMMVELDDSPDERTKMETKIMAMVHQAPLRLKLPVRNQTARRWATPVACRLFASMKQSRR